MRRLTRDDYRHRRLTHAVIAASPTAPSERIGVVAELTLPGPRLGDPSRDPRFIPPLRDPGNCLVRIENGDAAVWQYALAGMPITMYLYTAHAIKIVAEAYLSNIIEYIGCARFLFSGKPATTRYRRRLRYTR